MVARGMREEAEVTMMSWAPVGESACALVERNAGPSYGLDEGSIGPSRLAFFIRASSAFGSSPSPSPPTA